MTTRFHVDLLHPGWVAETWQEWFIGVKALRRLVAFAVLCAAVLVAVFLLMIVPTQSRVSRDVMALPALQRDVAARDADLGVLRANLQALSDEARRQVKWAEVLTTLSQQVPPTMKLVLVESSRPTPAPTAGQPQAAPPARPENLLRVEAVTPVRPGSTPLIEAAQFMAGVMRDPAVNRRFQLKSWEIKPGAPVSPGGVQLLNISVVLSERAS